MEPLLGCDVEREEDGAPGSIRPARTLMLAVVALLAGSMLWWLR